VLEYLGRKDQQLKLRGYRIEVGEIEQRLRQHPAVVEAVVVGKGAAEQIERLVGYVVLQPGAELRVEELRRHMEETLPGYMVPSAWVQLERLPLLANAKVDRLALPEPDQSRPNLKETYVRPQTEAERIVDNIWQGVLRLEKIGINDNFFDLGGHSLLLLQVHDELHQAFGKEVSILDMFQYPTISSLANYLTRGEGAFIGDNGDRADTRKQSRKRQREMRQEVRATRYQQ
jgi:acyl carrier protein